MSKPIFVVFGSTGEYSDRSEWVVCAYDSEDAAKAHVVAAEARAKEYEAAGHHTDYDCTWEQREARRSGWMPDLDQNFSMDYTGTIYYYGETMLRLASEETK